MYVCVYADALQMMCVSIYSLEGLAHDANKRLSPISLLYTFGPLDIDAVRRLNMRRIDGTRTGRCLSKRRACIEWLACVNVSLCDARVVAVDVVP